MNRSYVSKDFTVARSVASGTNFAALVIPDAPKNQQHRLRRLKALGPAAAANIDIHIPRKGLSSTVTVAVAAEGTAITLAADDDGYINGYQVQDNDFLLVLTDNTIDSKNFRHGYRVLLISGASEDAANDEVDLTVSGLDGLTGVEAPVVAGAPAYILPAAQAINYITGAATIEKTDVAAGDPGQPLVLLLDPDSGGAHDMSVYGETY